MFQRNKDYTIFICCIYPLIQNLVLQTKRAAINRNSRLPITSISFSCIALASSSAPNSNPWINARMRENLVWENKTYLDASKNICWRFCCAMSSFCNVNDLLSHKELIALAARVVYCLEQVEDNEMAHADAEFLRSSFKNNLPAISSDEGAQESLNFKVPKALFTKNYVHSIKVRVRFPFCFVFNAISYRS